MSDHPEFVPTLRAARMLGMSDAALRRRVRRGLLPVYRDPADRRVKLLKVSDLEALATSRRVLPASDPEIE